jgi:TRAP-type C4-dicarboxylate transport system permease small subunit
MILLLFSVLQGIAAFFAIDLKKIMKPAFNKFLHNFTSVACFVVGMVSLIYGYQLGMMKLYSTDDVRRSMIAFAVVTTILSLIGAMKSALTFLQSRS